MFITALFSVYNFSCNFAENFQNLLHTVEKRKIVLLIFCERLNIFEKFQQIQTPINGYLCNMKGENEKVYKNAIIFIFY